MANSTKWCYTVNNWTETDYATFAAIDCKYQVIGKETGDSGTPHLQGYIVFQTNKRISALKKLHPTAHFEPAKGSHIQASDYCKKDGEFAEFGDFPSSRNDNGKREQERYADALIAAKEGRFDDVPADLFTRFYNTYRLIRKDYMQTPADMDDVTGVWYYGAPGTGKSRQARIDYPDSYLKMQNKWWDGYQDQSTVIIDDFDSKELGHHLKIWADRYAFLAEVKGGAINIRPQIICVTSNYHPEQFDWDDAMKAAVIRRFKIKHFENIFKPV